MTCCPHCTTPIGKRQRACVVCGAPAGLDAGAGQDALSPDPHQFPRMPLWALFLGVVFVLGATASGILLFAGR